VHLSRERRVSRSAWQQLSCVFISAGGGEASDRALNERSIHPCDPCRFTRAVYAVDRRALKLIDLDCTVYRSASRQQWQFESGHETESGAQDVTFDRLD
jgi:hypothetical protein